MAQHFTGHKQAGAQQDKEKIPALFISFVLLFLLGLPAVPPGGDGSGALHTAGNLHHPGQKGVRIFGGDPQLFCGESQRSLFHFLQLVDLPFDLGGAVGAVQTVDAIGLPTHSLGHTLPPGGNGGGALHTAGNLQHLRQKGVRIFGGNPQLFCGKGQGGLLHFLQLVDLPLDLGGAVGAV